MDVTSGEIVIRKIPLGPYQANCYVVSDHRTGEALVIDAPGDAEDILREAGASRVRCIALTHTHSDHLEALPWLRERLGVDVAVHPSEAGRIVPPAERWLNGGDVLQVGRLRFRVLHTPGHTAGSVCLLCGDHLFSGDTLFPGGPGNTGSPDDFNRIKRSMVTTLFVLPDNTAVHPGHGPDTVLGKEKQEFSLFLARPHKPDLHGDVVWLQS